MAAVKESCNVSLSPQDLLKEVRNFVQGSTYKAKVSSEDLARSALLLLQTLPAARPAVLEHLCNVFDEAVNQHIRQIEHGTRAAASEGSDLGAVIEDVKGVMMGFVKSNPDAWAPIISAWSIELLGRISSQYAGRRAVPHSSSLNELLQLWMTCPATSVLIEIASECFASMVGSTPDVCVSALLEASVKHSPHFDWVVAHIGSCFPTTIITRVLMCGLKDFYLHGHHHPEASSTLVVGEEKVPKLASVVGILGHLAAQHRNDIRVALVNLFKESLQDDCEEMHVAAVPFLLHLASMSSLLFRIITLDFVNTVTPAVLNKLALQFTQKQSPIIQDKRTLVTLLVHLITTADVGCYKILQFLIDRAVPQHHKGDDMDTDDAPLKEVQETCCTIMEHLLLEIQHKVQVQGSGSNEISFLSNLQDHVADICRQMVRAEGKRFEWLAQTLCFIASYCNDTCVAKILSTILQEATDSPQLGVFIRIQYEAQMFHADLMGMTTKEIVELLGSQEMSPQRMKTVLHNLHRLAQWESKQESRLQARNSIQASLHTCLSHFTPCLYYTDIEVSAVAMELLTTVGLPWKIRVDCATKLCYGTINFFFHCLHSTESALKCQNIRLCHRYMEMLSREAGTQRLLTRLLIEGALSKEHAPAFGAKVDPQVVQSELVKKPTVGLLSTNQRRGVASRSQGHARVFHGGIIGQGLKPQPKLSPFTQEEQICNRHLLVDALWVCNNQLHNMGRLMTSEEDPAAPMTSSQDRRSGGFPISAAVGRKMALLLIELAAPDVMYNGIPWPEEEFMKVTVERDLEINKRFEDNPILWDVMEVLSYSPGAVCYCSALLRGVAATLIAHWDSCREKAARNMPRHLDTSQKLMECLRKGALIPPPLCYVGELFPELTPYEVCLLLQTVWRYMKENPPIPDPKENLARGCDRRYTDVIQSIIHANIEKLGHVFSRFQARPPKS